MRIVLSIILGVFLVFLALQSHLFYKRGESVRADLGEAQAELERVRLDADAIRSDRDYYGNPMNLEKELRARFNYRATDEDLMILVPSASSSRP